MSPEVERTVDEFVNSVIAKGIPINSTYKNANFNIRHSIIGIHREEMIRDLN